MTNPKMLCLNMIVRNEMSNLERCLGAVADHINCWVICDTGSTDGTQEFIKSFFAKRNLPGELHSFPFHNFEQARNAALDCAYASPLDFDYLLFADADMELVVEDHGFRERLEEPGYRLLQRSDALTYWNTRLVQRKVGARYHGVTHEYLDVPGEVKELRGVWYKDHASGSNRVDKFERDIRLLLEALKQEPENHRYWFYLAQSYRDAGQTEKAAEAYAKRAEMGGWDEEAWNARLQQARCLRQLGDEGGFVSTALAAFNQRPQRAEPLYDLARFYREKGMNDVSMLFSEAGLAIKRPDQDILFLEDFVYTAGLQEEFSIAANYARDPARKDRGFAACNWLALNREIPAGSRNLARSNLFFYVQPAGMMMPSFIARPIGFTAPDGFHASNPSVARLGDDIVLVQRSVNVILTDDGQYRTPNDEPERARNFLLHLNDELAIKTSTEILEPADMPKSAFQRILGFQDLRPFAWRGELWGCATVRELNPAGWYEQVLVRIDDRGGDLCRMTDWRVLHPEGLRRHEKNWMPRVSDETLQFIYLCDPTRVMDENARTIIESTPAIAAEEFRGGSQLIPFDGGCLALVHEVMWHDNRRIYLHRFVWFDETNLLRGVSRQFFFQKKGVEFAAGLAWHPDATRLLISYGVDDREAWIATVDAAEVQAVLEDVDRLPSAAQQTLRRDQTVAQAAIIEASSLVPAIAFSQDKSLDCSAEATALDEIIPRRILGAPSAADRINGAEPNGDAGTQTAAVSHNATLAVPGESPARPRPAAAIGREQKRRPANADRRPGTHGGKHAHSENARAKTIGLCMIVKNEAHVILRCLKNVRPLVDYVLIQDTGSTDATQTIIRDYLDREGLSGRVFEVPWRDFSYNRSVALAELRKNNQVDYALIMDADDLLVFDEHFDPARFKASLSKDLYQVEVRRDTIAFHRGQIVSNRRQFRYRGVLHEVLVGPREYASEIASGFYISYGQEGARGQDPNKYRKDAELLERALRTEKDTWLRSRYTFYLAQSFFGCDEKEKALETYLKRTDQGYWEEEIYWSLYRAAGLKEALGHPLDEVLATYSKATAVCPGRAEALYEATRRCRLNNRFAEGYELAKRGSTLPQPRDGLFIEPWIYQYGLLDELAVIAYWLERYEESLRICERLLSEERCPQALRDRIERNRDFARQKLATPVNDSAGNSR